MRLSLLLLFVFLGGCAHPSGKICNSTPPENFQPFLKRFLEDKQFAMSRTLYPLVTINYEAGNEDGNSVNKTLSTREENAKFPALTEYMEKNDLVHKIKSVDDSRALVMIYKPDTDWLYDLHYTNKNGCWVFTEIHDYSV
jgi:hypothetical protein